MTRSPEDVLRDLLTPRPIEDYHEDQGAVLWWVLPVCEPPWVGTPLDSDWDDDNYFTHWTPLPPVGEYTF